MQDGVKRQAREFAQQSADRLKEGVLERLRAVESNQAVMSMRHRALACTLELSLDEFYGLADDPGWPVLLEWAEATLVHNLQREEVQEAIRGQVRSAFERLEEDTLGDWLSEYGTLEITVEQGTEAMAAIIGGLAATEDFEHWLGDLLSEALV